MANKVTATYLILLVFSLVVCSCGTGVRTGRNDVKPLTASYSGSVSNQPYQVKHSDHRSSSLLNLFEVYDSAQSSIAVSFNSKNELLLSYITPGGIRTVTFSGEFKRSGYYEVFLRNKRTEIPPFLPLFYSKVDVKRLRLMLTPENNLLVDDTWQRTGNIFILAGGGKERAQRFFRAKSVAVE